MSSTFVAETFVFRSSSNLATASYDPETQELTLEFQSGDEYTYQNVPAEVYDRLIKAPSAGQFFHRHIKNLYSFTFT